MRRACARIFLAAAVALLLLAGDARAQLISARFTIESVGDSTFVFRTGRVSWVRAGMQGIAVDPVSRDALVARFRVLSVGETRATAIITGQTTFVSTGHVALLEEPPRRFWRERYFWVGMVFGAITGALGALAM